MCRSPLRSARVISDGQRPGRRGFDLAAILAQLGLDEGRGRAPCRCPASVAPAIGLVVGVEQAVLVQLPAALERAIAQRDVVRLRAGEVLQGRAALIGRDDAKVGLEAAAQQHAGLGAAIGEHALDHAGSGVKASASVVSAPLARMSRSPLVSAPRRTLPTVAISAAGRVFLQIRDQRVGHLGRARQQVTAGEALPLFDRLKNQLLLLAAHALDAANAAGLGGRGQVVEALDAQLLVEHGDGLRSDALQPQHVEQRRRKLGQQVAADCAIAGRRDLANASGEVLADAVPAAQRRFIERRRRLRPHATRCRRRCDTRES